MRNDFESNYLMHHGILGQKWGQQNGPPYPLSKREHDKVVKKAKKDAEKGNKWATEKEQPSSIRASIAAGRYAANPSKKNEERLKRANDRDELRWKTARTELKRKKQNEALEKARIARQKKAEEQRQAEEFEKKKAEILRSGDASLIVQNKERFTDQEIQNALNRIRNENEIKSYVQKKEKSGFDKIDSMMNKTAKVMDWAVVGMGAYNITADLYNTFLADEGAKWKKIPNRDWQKKK